MFWFCFWGFWRLRSWLCFQSQVDVKSTNFSCVFWFLYWRLRRWYCLFYVGGNEKKDRYFSQAFGGVLLVLFWMMKQQKKRKWCHPLTWKLGGDIRESERTFPQDVHKEICISKHINNITFTQNSGRVRRERETYWKIKIQKRPCGHDPSIQANWP